MYVLFYKNTLSLYSVLRTLCVCVHVIALLYLFVLQATPVNGFLGFTYLLKAAECGLRVAMVTVAEAFESGNNLAPPTGVDIPGYTGIKPR